MGRYQTRGLSFANYDADGSIWGMPAQLQITHTRILPSIVVKFVPTTSPPVGGVRNGMDSFTDAPSNWVKSVETNL
jgi:hypothetical protein